MGKFSEGFKVFVRAKNSNFSSEEAQEYWRGFLRKKLRASMGSKSWEDAHLNKPVVDEGVDQLQVADGRSDFNKSLLPEVLGADQLSDVEYVETLGGVIGSEGGVNGGGNEG